MKNFWNKLCSKVSSLFKDSGIDSWSSNRFAYLFTVIISNLSIFGVWIGLSIASGSLIDINWAVLTLYGMANGLTITSKLISKKMETKNEI